MASHPLSHFCPISKSSFFCLSFIQSLNNSHFEHKPPIILNINTRQGKGKTTMFSVLFALHLQIDLNKDTLSFATMHAVCSLKLVISVLFVISIVLTFPPYFRL